MSHNGTLDEHYQTVREFYDGKSVFITGATGFLGKAYVEKLAYSCPGIVSIYILIRDKKGSNTEERMRKYLDQPIFSRIKYEHPEYFKKIIPISGDITAPKLGLCDEERNILINEVSIVIHSAASVKLNDHLKFTLNTNVGGTMKVLELVKEMKNLAMFVYVSTAYSNTSQRILEEKLYPQSLNLNEIQKFAEEHYILGKDNDEMIKFIGNHPNTYAYTKALAENLVAEEHGEIPTIIIRPSIITASAEEPVRGFVDSWSGATAMAAFALKGWNNIMYSTGEENIDLIPLDYVVNLTLVAIAKYKPTKEVTVYHVTTSDLNPISIRRIFIKLSEFASKNPTSNAAPFAATTLLTKQKPLIKLVTFLMQTTPAFLADLWMKTQRKEAKFVKQHNLVVRSRDQLEFFTSQSWLLRCERARVLSAALSDSDRAVFRCDPSTIDWDQYLPIYFEGINKHLFKNKL
ncbi:fatty-acyl reductase [Bombyx mori]|uniref:Fatty acyl-CoA reductase n=2 Tax=Bombyx mori TaxID=7091 RepID=Q7YTA9_BOMMO|nr:fatty-acyl reductase [Bombyx mori]BAC79425.1 pheromone gland-specific fatty-acyl reductase [Bombyx mori]